MNAYQLRLVSDKKENCWDDSTDWVLKRKVMQKEFKSQNTNSFSAHYVWRNSCKYVVQCNCFVQFSSYFFASAEYYPNTIIWKLYNLCILVCFWYVQWAWYCMILRLIILLCRKVINLVTINDLCEIRRLRREEGTCLIR